MGSMITLGIGRMELDWGKNNSYRDHSALFQTTDIKDIPYYYVDMHTDEPIIERKEGYSRKLSLLRRRLDLLGYDIGSLKRLYEDAIQEHFEFGYKIHLPFEKYYESVKSIDIMQVDTVSLAVESHENGYDFGEYVRRCIFEDPSIKSAFIDGLEKDDPNDWKDPKFDLSQFLENLDPYIMLRIIAENPKNSECELQWNYFDVVDNGWVKREEIVKELSPQEKVLIVTEGSSDSFILRKTLDVLYPDIADFFNFVDMEENYPFTGVGNLYNFCLGLVRISIQNKIIVVFDNDTAGIEKYEQATTLDKPSNFLVTKLPDHHCFANIKTRGPQGETNENVNGKAVAIECFLDLRSLDCEPHIQWTSYNRKKGQYQGELENKDKYVQKFKQADLKNGCYDVERLIYLMDYLLAQWIERK